MAGPQPPTPTASPAERPKRPAVPVPRALMVAGLTVLLAGAVALGLALRLEDPSSTTVVPAEDPYTHMALVREHLRDGTLDPLNEPGTMYPPGMHALLAATVAYTGVDLYELTRLGPAFIGALGLAGLAILLARFESLGAAIAGVLTLAVMPEAVFRSTMMSPTALDLALLPFLILCVLETLQGRLAWAAPTAALAAFLVFSHPWVFGILGVAGLALLLLVTLLPWSARRGSLPTAWGVVAVVAIVGSGIALSLNGCWGGCGPGFRDVFDGDSQQDLRAMTDTLAWAVLIGSLVPLGVKAAFPRAFRNLFPVERRGAPFAARLLLGQLLLAAAVGTFLYARQGGFPPLVQPLIMFGWPILVLAALGLAALAFRPSPAGHAGAALALGTLPFVVFNPFDSPFWSHRTAVYLGLGMAILCGVAVAALVQATVAMARRMPMPGAAPGQRSAGTTAALGVTGLLVLVALAGGAYAATPGQYPGGWYRMYSECEMDGLREVAQMADADPGTLVVSGAWQSKLVLAALADDARRLWFKPDFFTNAQERQNTLDYQEQLGDPILVVVDSKLNTTPEIRPGDTAFLQADPWVEVGTWCSGAETLTAYSVRG